MSRNVDHKDAEKNSNFIFHFNLCFNNLLKWVTFTTSTTFINLTRHTAHKFFNYFSTEIANSKSTYVMYSSYLCPRASASIRHITNNGHTLSKIITIKYCPLA